MNHSSRVQLGLLSSIHQAGKKGRLGSLALHLPTLTSPLPSSPAAGGSSQALGTHPNCPPAGLPSRGWADPIRGWFSGLVKGRRKFTHQQFLNKRTALGLKTKTQATDKFMTGNHAPPTPWAPQHNSPGQRPLAATESPYYLRQATSFCDCAVR